MLKLSTEELEAGADSLVDSKLSASQIEDLVSFFRIFLCEFAKNYTIKPTLEALTDDTETNTCAKLAACLARWQDMEFDDGGFAATNANRTGFNMSVDNQEFKLFKYAFTLLFDLPPQMSSQYLNKGRVQRSGQGTYKFTLP